jgi:hypothetical protein
LTEKNVNSNCPSSLPAKKLEERFDAIAAAKDLLESNYTFFDSPSPKKKKKKLLIEVD